MEKRLLGSVLVVGGGIPGMQSALDLAESGFLVYLVEKRYTIGSIMPRREKNFPVNECAMCTMSPLLLNVIRQPNIEILTGAELIGLVGKAGDFKATVLKKAAQPQCNQATGCGACAKVHSVDGLDEDADIGCRACVDTLEESNVGNIADQVVELEVGAVILSNRNAVLLAQKLGVGLSNYYDQNNELECRCTAREGIFTCGVFQEPKNIPDTVVDASSAAAHVSRLLAKARGSLVRQKVFPPERQVSHEKPKVGVFVCNGGNNISNVVDTAQVVAYAKNLNGVVYAQEYMYLCARHNMEKIKQGILEHNLNRVVVASCTPSTHEPLFQDYLQEAGLNRCLYEQANIREQVSWVHQEMPDKATEKAKDLVKMAVTKVSLQKPVQTIRININPRVLVLGGGIAGMASALSLGEQGYEVVLTEKTSELGGYARQVKNSLAGGSPATIAQDLIKQITTHPKIRLLLNAEISDVNGYVGNIVTTFKLTDLSTVKVEHGAVIIATGAKPVKPDEYLYGKHPLVVTQQEFEQSMEKLQFSNQDNIVMIQCVGSRQENRPYCSSICCTQAIKNALKIKEKNPNINIYVLYREIKTKEKDYITARLKGINFIQFSDDNKPKVINNNDKVGVQIYNQITGRSVSLSADLLVLSNGIEPGIDNQLLSQYYKAPLDDNGFFTGADKNFRPLDSDVLGLFLCGLAQGPKTMEESISQAHAAAMRAAAFLARGSLPSLSITAEVDEELCNGCGLCVNHCPYGARVINEYRKVALVREELCQGCGSCVSVCPGGASQQRGFEKEQLINMIEAALL